MKIYKNHKNASRSHHDRRCENLTQTHNCSLNDEIIFAKNLRRKAILFVHLIDKDWRLRGRHHHGIKVDHLDSKFQRWGELLGSICVCIKEKNWSFSNALHFLKTLFRDICPFGQSLLKPLYHSRISTKKRGRISIRCVTNYYF